MTDFPWAKGVTKYYGKGKLQLSEVYIYMSTDICTSRTQGALLQKALWLLHHNCVWAVVMKVQCWMCKGSILPMLWNNVGGMDEIPSPLGSSVELR